jgi:hypothetical protein
MEWSISIRPIKPGSPHINGKVERSQKADLQEFYTTVELKDEAFYEPANERIQNANYRMDQRFRQVKPCL